MINSPDQEENVVPSPCCRHCCLDEQDICLGCFRSLAEITGWCQADSLSRREILAKCQQRKSDRSKKIVGA
ncbi:DUF1289 domain-containing protein [Pontibacter sp. JAM-7]|uniref:DUF1289 domain-containing protein n=1 Tax=Pontibacter sp. JAM-7 TaxID=3366581 RepID=UPI003AF72A5F